MRASETLRRSVWGCDGTAGEERIAEPQDACLQSRQFAQRASHALSTRLAHFHISSILDCLLIPSLAALLRCAALLPLLLFSQIISDPSAADLERFLREGRLMTYRKMSMIKNRMTVGHKLNECIERMAERMQEQEQEEEEAARPQQQGQGKHRAKFSRAAPVSPLHHVHGEEDPLAGLFPVSRSRHLHMDRTNETLE